MDDSLDLTQAPLIRELYPGMLEEGYFLVKKIHLNIGKKKKPFLRLILSDKTGHLPAVYFDSERGLKSVQAQIGEGDVIRVKGLIEEYQDVIQIKLLKVEKEEKEKWQMSRFLKRTMHDRRELHKELQERLGRIGQPKLKSLCNGFLRDKEFMTLFLDAPASRFFHHAYIGGLIEHTLSVVKLVDAYANLYPEADRDLLLTGAFLHDIGKADEYQYLIYHIDQSTQARLKGHTLLGYERIRPHLDRVKLDEHTRLKLEHIIISHQGKKVWGAIEEPRFLEAYLIHAADSTDSTQFVFSQARREAHDQKDSPGNMGAPGQMGQGKVWSQYISYLDREIYLG